MQRLAVFGTAMARVSQSEKPAIINQPILPETGKPTRRQQTGGQRSDYKLWAGWSTYLESVSSREVFGWIASASLRIPHFDQNSGLVLLTIFIAEGSQFLSVDTPP